MAAIMGANSQNRRRRARAWADYAARESRAWAHFATQCPQSEGYVAALLNAERPTTAELAE